jgi:hypothetical protein
MYYKYKVTIYLYFIFETFICDFIIKDLNYEILHSNAWPFNIIKNYPLVSIFYLIFQMEESGTPTDINAPSARWAAMEKNDVNEDKTLLELLGLLEDHSPIVRN